MITLILPGFSAKNKEWVQDVAKNLKLDGRIRPIFWEHWDDSGKTFNPKQKADLLVRHFKGERLNMIGKSVGTLVASFIVDKIPNQINKIILCGIPSTSDKRLEIYKESFGKLLPEKIVVFQNSKDPLASFPEVKKFMSKVNPKIQVIEKNRSDHSYPYFEDFNSYLIS